LGQALAQPSCQLVTCTRRLYLLLLLLLAIEYVCKKLWSCGLLGCEQLVQHLHQLVIGEGVKPG
jgi:hypothetical protein